MTLPTRLLAHAESHPEIAADLREAAGMVHEWRPIATAPKDGTEVLLFGLWAGEISGISVDASQAIGLWGGGKSDYGSEGWWDLTGSDAYATWMLATHWMPLPSPPEGAPMTTQPEALTQEQT